MISSQKKFALNYSFEINYPFTEILEDSRNDDDLIDAKFTTPRYSPDGEYLGFSAQLSGFNATYDLFISYVDETKNFGYFYTPGELSDTRHILLSGANVTHLSWSTDMTQIIYTIDVGTYSEIMLADFNLGTIESPIYNMQNRRSITNNANSFDREPAFSRKYYGNLKLITQ